MSLYRIRGADWPIAFCSTYSLPLYSLRSIAQCPQALASCRHTGRAQLHGRCAVSVRRYSMLSHSQLFPLLSKCLGRVGALMAENSVAAVWVTNDPKVREYSRTIDRQRRVVSAVVDYSKSAVVLTHGLSLRMRRCARSLWPSCCRVGASRYARSTAGTR